MRLNFAPLFMISLLISASAFAGPFPPEVQNLKTALLISAWKSFTEDMSSLIEGQDAKVDASQFPHLDPNISRNDLLNVFIEQEIKLNRSHIPDTKAFTEKILKMYTSYSHNLPYARVAFLQTVPPIPQIPVGQVRLQTLALPTKYPDNHTIADLNKYVQERFPEVLQKFVRQTNSSLYLDSDNCQSALQLQKSDGFSEAFRFIGPRDTEESQFLITYQPSTKKYRFLVCALFGEDDRSRIVAIIGKVFSPQFATYAIHHPQDPLLALNPGLWDNLQVNPTRDRVVIGYQNSVWWELFTKGQNWSRVSLVDSGIEVSGFFNSKTGEQIISLENIYGDEMNESLEVFYKKGFRRFLYLGTAGGLDAAYQLGDVILPSRFENSSGHRFAFPNSAVEWKFSFDNESKNQIHMSALQGWVPDLIVETRDLMKWFRDSGVQAIDIESQYFAEFSAIHTDVTEHGVIIGISDLPLGDITYDKESLTRGLVTDNMNKIIDQIIVGIQEPKK